jgi:hypothetical protein
VADPIVDQIVDKLYGDDGSEPDDGSKLSVDAIDNIPDRVRRQIEQLQDEVDDYREEALAANARRDRLQHDLTERAERAERDNEDMKDLLYGEPDKFGMLGVVPRLEKAEKALQGIVTAMDNPHFGIAHARAIEEALNEGRDTLKVLQSLGNPAQERKES